MKQMMRTKAGKSIGATIAAVAMFSAVGTQVASAHGYIESPSSRSLLCNQGENVNCGAIQWEPQSLEAPKGFPGPSVPDGQIASAGGAFPELDQQTSDRWAKVNISPGEQTFTWHLTAMHSTDKWHYYITKEDWNPNQPLTRDQFELQPFYEVSDGGARPNQKVNHTVNVPERTGYHVILGVWDVDDTVNAFYNTIDVDFGNGSNTYVPEFLSYGWQ